MKTVDYTIWNEFYTRVSQCDSNTEDKPILTIEQRNLFDEALLNQLNQSHLFHINDKILNLLLKTSPAIYDRKLPFDSMFLNIKIGRVKGLLVSKISYALNENTEIVATSMSKDLLEEYCSHNKIITQYTFCFIGEDYSGRKMIDIINTRKLDVEFIKSIIKERYDDIEYTKEVCDLLPLILCNFVDFLNEKGVELVTTNSDNIRNKKRINRNKPPLPTMSHIRLHGSLKEYCDGYSDSDFDGYSHKFWVRGHFRVLNNDRYINKKTLWIKPYIKGKGILIKKEYQVFDGQE